MGPEKLHNGTPTLNYTRYACVHIEIHKNNRQFSGKKRAEENIRRVEVGKATFAAKTNNTQTQTVGNIKNVAVFVGAVRKKGMAKQENPVYYFKKILKRIPSRYFC